MKSIVKVEVLRASDSLFVTLGDHVLKSYDTFGKELSKAIRTAERYASNYINKYFKGIGIIETYKHNKLVTRIEYSEGH